MKNITNAKIEKAVRDYRWVLGIEDLPPDLRASAVKQLADTLCDLARRVPPKKMLKHIVEAVGLYRKAQKYLNDYGKPVDYADCSYNLGFALRTWAALLPANLRMKKLNGAIRAYGQVLRVRTMKNAPVKYGMTKHFMGNVLHGMARS